MQKLNDRDVLWIMRRLPDVVVASLKRHQRGLFLAGGFIRACVANEEANDVDLFVGSKEAAKAVAMELAAEAHRGSVHETENAFTVKGHYLPVQIIHRWTFETPQQCVKSFDFTIARAAIWIEDEAHFPGSCCDDRFYPDLAAKRLVYCSPVRNEEAGGSMLRVLKFYQRGYRIPLDSLGAVMARMVANLDFEGAYKAARCNGTTTEEQISKVLTGLLREVDPNIDPHHLSHLPAMN